MLRVSTDGGYTWSNEILGDTGAPGQYGYEVEWWMLGQGPGLGDPSWRRPTRSPTGTAPVLAYSRTRRKPSGGSAWPPSRVTSTSSSNSGSCTPTVGTCRRTTLKPPGCFRLAAEQGDVDAQFSLGVMYADGSGVQQDEVGSRPVVPPSRRAGPRRRPGQPRVHCTAPV